MQEFNDQIGRAAVKTGLQRWHIIAAIISECRSPMQFCTSPNPNQPVRRAPHAVVARL